jgi:hypothetical protein
MSAVGMGGRRDVWADLRMLAVVTVLACGFVLAWLPHGELPVALVADDAAVPQSHAEVTLPRELVATADAPRAEADCVDVASPPASMPLAPGAVDELVGALHDDDIRGNGRAAFYALCDQPRGALPALVAAMHSRDGQQRTFARSILRVRCDRRACVPTPELLAATIDDLRPMRDSFLLDTHVWPVRKHSLLFLCAHGAAALPALRQALDSQDLQQRTLAAFALATLGDDTSAPRVVQVLVGQLADNETGGDALFASHALYRLGRSGLSSIGEWRPYVDEQARSRLDLVVLDLQSPPRTRRDLEARQGRHRITGLYHDPVVEYDLHRSGLPRF